MVIGAYLINKKTATSAFQAGVESVPPPPPPVAPPLPPKFGKSAAYALREALGTLTSTDGRTAQVLCGILKVPFTLHQEVATERSEHAAEMAYREQEILRLRNSIAEAEKCIAAEKEADARVAELAASFGISVSNN